MKPNITTKNKKKEPRISWVKKLGPGLITGAADDDPSGIATYSQAGAEFGLNMLWTVVFTYPLMVGIQMISARIGRVTGQGLATNIRNHYPRWILYALIGLLFFANTINIAADVSAMGSAMNLIVGGPAQIYVIGFGLVSLLLQVFIPYTRYVSILKWLTLALLAYVAAVFVEQIPWGQVVVRTFWPQITWSDSYLTTVVGLFGTTISPYLFFWQASQEAEDRNIFLAAESAGTTKQQQPSETPQAVWQAFKRIKIDTLIGMGFSNLVAFCIILTAAITLNIHGVTDIQTSSDAAKALRPIAGDFAFFLFSLGIIGTGLLAIPVLAGSSAYAIAEALNWPNRSLEMKPTQAKGFYSVIIISTLLGVALGLTKIDPIKALYLSAVVNGVIAVPIMGVMMLMAVKPQVMGTFVLSRKLRVLGWTTVFFMATAVIAMFVL